LWLGTSALGLTIFPTTVGAQTYGLSVPSFGALNFGQINPATGGFTTVSNLPNWLVLPLGLSAANPIAGEYYFAAGQSTPNFSTTVTSFDTMAVNGSTGASRFLNSSYRILGFDVANDLLIASSLDGTGNHIVTIDP